MDESYVFMMGTCFACSKVFSFNPHKVPSIRIEGERRPVCRECIEQANPKRVANGLEPVQIQDGAYDIMPESEL